MTWKILERRGGADGVGAGRPGAPARDPNPNPNPNPKTPSDPTLLPTTGLDAMRSVTSACAIVERLGWGVARLGWGVARRRTALATAPGPAPRRCSRLPPAIPCSRWRQRRTRRRASPWSSSPSSRTRRARRGAARPRARPTRGDACAQGASAATMGPVSTFKREHEIFLKTENGSPLEAISLRRGAAESL